MELPISLTAARNQGLPIYFTGKPCIKGHISPRYALSGSCRDCHREFTAAHRAAGSHKEKFAAWYEEKRLLSPEYFIVQSAKRRAKTSNIPFDLTIDYIKSIWPEDNCCPVLGVPFSEIRKKGHQRNLNTPSLDKIIPELGYIQGNVAIISLQANYMKSNVTDPALFRRLADWLEEQLCVKG